MRMLFACLFFSTALFSEEITTLHTLESKNGTLSYSASVGSLPVLDVKGEKKGEISYIAYVKDSFDKERPITFAFNGGPGSASIWLHMGTFGPRRILSPEEGQSTVPPYAIVDNPETILDLTDVVFVDPIGTGFSKATTPDDALPYYSLEGDVRSVGDFIRDYITENKRWNSPKFIAGESYGTLRACGLAHYLQSQHGMYLNGLMLISCAIDFETLQFGGGEESLLSLLLYVPTYATTAWYHGRYRPDATLEEVANEARQFSYKQYAPWLLQPTSFNRSEQNALYEKLATLCGIEIASVKRLNGRLDDGTFVLQFFPDEKKVVGRFDTRCIGDYPSLRYLNDPSGSIIEGIFAGAFHEYLQKELGKSSFYPSFSEDVNRLWDFSSKSRLGYPNFIDRLKQAMTSNPQLKVFVGAGYFDLATPFAAAEYCFDHLDLPSSYAKNIQMEYYDGGHMYYLNPEARKKFKNDLERFFSKDLTIDFTSVEISEKGNSSCASY